MSDEAEPLDHRVAGRGSARHRTGNGRGSAEYGRRAWYGKSPLGAGLLSDLIQEGDISLGEDYTMEVGGRFHRVHAKLMAIACEAATPM